MRPVIRTLIDPIGEYQKKVQAELEAELQRQRELEEEKERERQAAQAAEKAKAKNKKGGKEKEKDPEQEPEEQKEEEKKNEEENQDQQNEEKKKPEVKIYQAQKQRLARIAPISFERVLIQDQNGPIQSLQTQQTMGIIDLKQVPTPSNQQQQQQQESSEKVFFIQNTSNNGNNGVLTSFFFETIFPNFKEPELVLVDNYITGKLPCVIPTWIGKDKKFIDDFVNRILKKKSEETLQLILELIIEGLQNEIKVLKEYDQAVGVENDYTTIVNYFSEKLQQNCTLKNIQFELIKLYTQETFIYQRLNYLLRNKKIKQLDNLFPFFLFLQMSLLLNYNLTTLLKKIYYKLPPVEQKVEEVKEEEQGEKKAKDKKKKADAKKDASEEPVIPKEQYYTILQLFEQNAIQEELRLRKLKEEEGGGGGDAQAEEGGEGGDDQGKEKKEKVDKILLYRAAYLSKDVLAKYTYNIGKQVYFSEFLSTTTQENIARLSVNNYNTIFFIEMIKQKKDMFQFKDQINNCASYLENTGIGKGEEEVIFPVGSIFKIKSWKRNARTLDRKYEITLECELVNQEIQDKADDKKGKDGKKKK